MERLLTIRDLKVWFPVRSGFLSGLMGKETKYVRALDGISLAVRRGEVFCLVGESGCGKTTTGKAILRLNEPTDGQILFDVPEHDWKRLEYIHERLRELWPRVRSLSPVDQVEAEARVRELAKLKKKIDALRGGRATLVERRLERATRSIEILEDRMEGLAAGKDATIKRLVSRLRRDIDLLREFGPAFRPRTQKRLHRLEREHKEARYRLHRAEVTGMRTGKWARRARRFEARLEGLRGRMSPNDPEARALLSQLEAELEARRRRFTDLELSHVRGELEGLRATREALEAQRKARVEATQEEFRSLERAIADLRSAGGVGLEALELHGQEKEISGRYDLVAWWHASGGLRGWVKRFRLYRDRMRKLRKKVQIIYQDPYESLNPKMSIFDIVAEPLIANKVVSTMSEAEAVIKRALEDVGLRPAEEYMLRFPHELSGGQRQRGGIATALVVDPDFIVADEPVSMLDASVRTEILALLLDLKKRRNLTYLFITHDLGLAWIIADRIAVMYLGKIVEMGDGPEIIQNPRHPYTKALISVVPSPNPDVQKNKIILRGERPNPVDIPAGCRFHPRCPLAVGVCGWSSDEVRDELTKLFAEDRGSQPMAETMGEITEDGPFALRLSSSDVPGAKAYLRGRIEALASARPALASIRKVRANGGQILLGLHVPAEPALRRIREDVWVACHLVDPELAAVSEAAAEPIVDSAAAAK